MHQIAKEGDTLAIGDAVCTIDTEAVRPEKPAPAAPAATAEIKPVTKAEPEVKPAQNAPADVKATPVAAAMIAENKVDSKKITPTGSNGKIIKQDVLEALEHPGRKPGIELFS